MKNLFKNYQHKKSFDWDENTQQYKKQNGVIVAIKKNKEWVGNGSNKEMVQILNVPNNIPGEFNIFQVEYVESNNRVGYICNYVSMGEDFSDEELAQESNQKYRISMCGDRVETKRLKPNMVLVISPFGNTISWMAYAKGNFRRKIEVDSTSITPEMHRYLMSLGQ
jgi:hypothetical protein